MTAPTPVRPEIPPLPDRCRKLPVDHRGYPVPWFVGWVDEDGHEVVPGHGRADHRVVGSGRQIEAIKREVCWICGERLGAHRTFVGGPLMAINRVSAEPPMHYDCGEWAARACPFLTRPYARRREAGMPSGTCSPGGVMLLENPGVTAVWTTKSAKIVFADGLLLALGPPTSVEWRCEGRVATRDEVDRAFADADDKLRAMTSPDDRAGMREISRLLEAAQEYLP